MKEKSGRRRERKETLDIREPKHHHITDATHISSYIVNSNRNIKKKVVTEKSIVDKSKS